MKVQGDKSKHIKEKLKFLKRGSLTEHSSKYRPILQKHNNPAKSSARRFKIIIKEEIGKGIF